MDSDATIAFLSIIVVNLIWAIQFFALKKMHRQEIMGFHKRASRRFLDD